MDKELINRFQHLKSRYADCVSQKNKSEIRLEQLNKDIEAIKAKYPDLKLDTEADVKELIASLESELSLKLSEIELKFSKLNF